MEIWKDIKGYENKYQISNHGRVKSLKFNNTKKEKILKMPKKNGYYCVSLWKNNKSKQYYVHILVAICFLNHNPCGYKKVIDHIDNNPLNNKTENLQIVSHRFNCSKDKKNKTSKYTGVSWCKTKGKYKSCIRINKKKITIGYFNSEYQAYLSYQEKLNFIKN